MALYLSKIRAKICYYNFNILRELWYCICFCTFNNVLKMAFSFVGIILAPMLGFLHKYQAGTPMATNVKNP